MAEHEHKRTFVRGEEISAAQATQEQQGEPEEQIHGRTKYMTKNWSKDRSLDPDARKAQVQRRKAATKEHEDLIKPFCFGSVSQGEPMNLRDVVPRGAHDAKISLPPKGDQGEEAGEKDGVVSVVGGSEGGDDDEKVFKQISRQIRRANSFPTPRTTKEEQEQTAKLVREVRKGKEALVTPAMEHGGGGPADDEEGNQKASVDGGIVFGQGPEDRDPYLEYGKMMVESIEVQWLVHEMMGKDKPFEDEEQAAHEEAKMFFETGGRDKESMKKK